MPKNKVSDPITDQEIAFARLVLSGAMTDRHAAEAVGLNPDSAAYTKSKPRVRAYMLEHRAAVQQQLVQQEADLSRRPGVPRTCRGGNASAEPGPRTSTGPPLGNRQPQPRNDPRQCHRPSQGPLHDRGHGKLHPRPSRHHLGEEILPCDQNPPAARPYSACPACPGVPRSMPWSPARRWACPPRLSRRAVERPRAQARSRLSGRGASGPSTQPVHLRQPLYPLRSPRTLCPLVRFCSRLGNSSPYKEPLCPPTLRLPILKRTQKYRILQITAG